MAVCLLLCSVVVHNDFEYVYNCGNVQCVSVSGRVCFHECAVVYYDFICVYLSAITFSLSVSGRVWLHS
jgi:hypothetical protein